LREPQQRPSPTKQPIEVGCFGKTGIERERDGDRSHYPAVAVPGAWTALDGTELHLDASQQHRRERNRHHRAVPKPGERPVECEQRAADPRSGPAQFHPPQQGVGREGRDLLERDQEQQGAAAER